MAKNLGYEDKSHNHIASGTQIIGNIITSGDIRVDGDVTGILICKGKLVIGESGSIKGDIRCVNAEILGDHEGNLQVNGFLSVKATAKIKGDIKTHKLSIEPEGVFVGSCDMSQNSEDLVINPFSEEDAAKT